MRRRKRLVALLLVVVLCVLCAGCGGGDASATVMRLTKTEGTVGVSDETGKKVSPVENMNLYGGYQMGTEEKSHAWIALDSVKLAKMDEQSEIEIQKDGKELEVIVNSGGLFFYVSEPLEKDETLDIRTSTMTVGIRGTCGWVEVTDETHMDVYILEGTVECTVTDSESGESKTEQVSGGEKAELWIYSGKEKCAIIKDELDLYEIPFYILEELLADEELGKKIQEMSGLEIPADGSEEAYVLRGTIRIFDGETEENLALSQEDYEKALELDETDALVYLGLADLCIRKSDYDGAMEILKTGLDKAADDSKIKEKIEEIESGTITDSQQRRRRYSAYDGSGNLAWYHEYFYDAEGRKSRTVAYDGSGTQTGEGEELYDEAGRSIQTWGWATQTGRLSRNTWEFDENGNRVRGVSYKENGELYDYRTNEYDGAGHLTRSDHYNADGTLNDYYIYEYDENGNRIGQSRYLADGTLRIYHVYENDANGRCIKDSRYEGDGTLIEYVTYTYDENGKRVSEQRFEPGE